MSTSGRRLTAEDPADVCGAGAAGAVAVDVGVVGDDERPLDEGGELPVALWSINGKRTLTLTIFLRVK